MTHSTLPLTYRFRSTSPAKAFFLAAFIQALVAVLAINVHQGLEDTKSRTYWTFKGLLHQDDSPLMKMVITFASAFLAAFVVMNIMWALFAYGGGMLADVSKKRVAKWW